MRKLIYCVAALALLCCAGSAQTPPSEEQPASNVPKVLPATTPLGTGPFKAIMEVDPTLAKHTVYRPNDISAVVRPSCRSWHGATVPALPMATPSVYF